MAGQRRATDDYRKALYESELPSTTKLVGLAMTEFMDHRTLADARPGPALLARRTGLAARTVKREVARLVRDGWLQQTLRGGSSLKRLASVYSGAIPTRDTQTRVNTANPCHTDTGQDGRPVTHRHGNPCHTDTPPSPTGIDNQAGASAPGPERAGAMRLQPTESYVIRPEDLP